MHLRYLQTRSERVPYSSAALSFAQHMRSFFIILRIYYILRGKYRTYDNYLSYVSVWVNAAPIKTTAFAFKYHFHANNVMFWHFNCINYWILIGSALHRHCVVWFWERIDLGFTSLVFTGQKLVLMYEGKTELGRTGRGVMLLRGRYGKERG